MSLLHSNQALLNGPDESIFLHKLRWVLRSLHRSAVFVVRHLRISVVRHIASGLS